MQTPATLVESFAIHPARTEQFDRWVESYLEALERAEGHGGTLRLEQASAIHHFISSFQSQADLDAWRRSETYRKLCEERRPCSAALVQHGSGAALCFTVPSEATARKWKRFLIVWASVLPVLLVLNTSVRTMLPGLPPIVQLCITSPILTALLTWVILPRVQRWSSYWMLQGSDGKLQRDPD